MVTHRHVLRQTSRVYVLQGRYHSHLSGGCWQMKHAGTSRRDLAVLAGAIAERIAEQLLSLLF